MPSAAMLFNLVRDCIASGVQERVPEPELIMADPAQAEAFMRAGREDGILAHTYLYHAIQASAFIGPGYRVLDLGCGPANQLAVLARLNPSAQFVGLDASDSMLSLAADAVSRNQLANVSLMRGDMQRLEGIATGSFDAVVCSMSLHHLADTAALVACCAEVQRVRRPDGGVYLVDFGRLSRASTQHFFAHDRSAIQPPVFTQDYFNSLRAAFSVPELRTAATQIPGSSVKRTLLVPFLTAICAGARQAFGMERERIAREMYCALTPGQQYDVRDLSRFFGHGGFPLAFRPW